LRLKWSDEQLKYFSKPIKTAERLGWLDKIDGFFWWIVLAVCLWAVIWMGYKLYCLYRIQLWLESI